MKFIKVTSTATKSKNYIPLKNVLLIQTIDSCSTVVVYASRDRVKKRESLFVEEKAEEILLNIINTKIEGING